MPCAASEESLLEFSVQVKYSSVLLSKFSRGKLGAFSHYCALFSIQEGGIQALKFNPRFLC